MRAFLFMSKPRLTNDDFCRAAKRLKCEVASIKAFGEVESKREAFDANGFPTILFERHKFYKYATNRKEWAKEHPDICNPVAGGYGTYASQKPKFDKAFALDPHAAMMSCSWGMFQVMGFNWKDLGYASVDDFVDQMKSGEAAHLDSFVRYILVNHLDDELRAKDWNTLALRYNGSDYKKNNYHVKLPAAYKKFAKEDIDCSQVPAAASPQQAKPKTDPAKPATDDPTEQPPDTIETPPSGMPPAIAPPKATEQTPDVQTDGQGNIAVTANTTTGGFKWLMTAIVAIITGQATVPEFVNNGLQSTNFWTVVLNIFQNLWTFKVYIIAAILLIFTVRKIETTVLKVAAMRLNADDTKGNVVLTKQVAPKGWITSIREKVGI